MGIIYEIICINTNRRYIGSTKLSKEERLQRHERHYKSYLKNKHNYISAWDILESGNYVINVLENVEDNNMLKDREQYYFENNECVNRYNPKRTLSVLRQSQTKHNALYRERNPEKYKEANTKRNISIECCCGKFVSKKSISRHMKTQIHNDLLLIKQNELSI